ncbi:uncharacterized protein LOC131850194 [Achroia grisella]|uniref:uncharacterized protein LOC131850194 n=1 Tax=Achroia grisella TaxID=688607 RepID=UPI0027D2ED04|nr:uncharacterized protein LOC131850194 [Achroia grisella]
MDTEKRVHTLQELEKYSYRVLQQISKSMSLPSNYKKVYLIQLIHAKQFGTMDEVHGIVQKVRLERQQLAQVKKKSRRRKTYVQEMEISSTSNSHSPPITITPKRTSQIVLSNSPVQQPFMNYPQHRVLQPRIVRRTYPSIKKSGSDRILRSFNIKTIKKTNYETLNVNNTLFNAVNTHTSSSDKMPFQMNPEAIHNPKWNITTNRIVEQPNQSILKTSNYEMKSNNKPSYHIPNNSTNTAPVMPPKRQRVLSGIYPITSKDITPKTNSYIHSIGIRHRDGKISKINALVQKSRTPTQKPTENIQNSCNNLEVTMQDIIDCNIDAQTNMNSMYSVTDANIPANNYLYPNMSSLNDAFGKHMCYNEGNEACNDMCDTGNLYTMYSHKKVRNDQMRSQKNYQREPEVTQVEKLPRINEVFSKFNDIHNDVRRPIYVQVSEEAERIRSYPIYVAGTIPNSTSLLEPLYNFRNQFVVHQPLLQVATTSNTMCTYSTPLIASAFAQQSTLVTTELLTASSCEQDSVINVDMDAMPRISDLLRYTEQEYNERSSCDKDDELSTTNNSLVKSDSQEIGASVTIPEMVEDALEIISQDGDYMERIGMDVRMQCILCSWAGPKFKLEYHIRKEHARSIRREERGAWRARVRAGAPRLVQHRAALYVVAARRRRACLVATLATISSETELPRTGSITIHNKITNEPYSWEGEIRQITPESCESDSNCLILELSKLGLSPEQANLDRVESPLTSITENQPDYNDIEVTMYVKIFD